jgi:3-oxoadipate enol-lactonase
MGGLTGLWLALHEPTRLYKLVLCSTGAKIGTADAWNTRIEAVRKNGTKSIAAATMERWFTATFREREAQTVERIQKTLANTNNEGYIACCEALRDTDLRDQVASISVPTLIISATHDPAAPPTDGKFLAKQIAGARYVELDAAHLSNIEQHEKFTQEVSQFLQKP